MYAHSFNSSLSLNGHALLPTIADIYSPHLNSKQYFFPKHTGLYGGTTEVTMANGETVEAIDYAEADRSEIWLQKHGASINQLKSSFVEIIIQGDTNRKIGDKVILSVPDHVQSNNTSDTNLDTTISGNYLVTKIKHALTAGGGHEMHLQLCKDSYIEKLPSVWYHEDLIGDFPDILPDGEAYA